MKALSPYCVKPGRKALLIVLALLILSGCATPTVAPTPTPTRTPHPTATPMPTPTPTPAFPVTAGCTDDVPATACTYWQGIVAQDPTHFAWTGQPVADVLLSQYTAPENNLSGRWTYAVATTFYSLDDENITSDDLKAAWSGTLGGTLAERPLYMTPDTLKALTPLLGPPSESTVHAVEAGNLLSETTAATGYAVIPFDELTPEWKVLRIDGYSVLEKGLHPGLAFLEIELALKSDRADAMSLLQTQSISFSNRVEDQMTIVAMTGVTAMTRAFASWMEQKGNTFAAEPIRDWLVTADFTHISNEVSFIPDCVPQPSGTMSFCSADKYIELLEYVGTDIVELTGNHLADKGLDPLRHSFELYKERGWRWYGGGENLADATTPLTITQGPNQLVFIGCNPVGPSYDWADETNPGSAPCDYDAMRAQVRQYRDEGYLPIVTLQYLEAEQYYPSPQQIRDFRSFAEAGALVVQGSQAHQIQTFEYYGDTFIAYGLGNIFFDQNWLEAKPDFINRLVFYNGRMLSIDIRATTMLDYGQRRPMTPEERRALLEMLIPLRPD